MLKKAAELAACALKSTCAQVAEAGTQQVRRMGEAQAELTAKQSVISKRTLISCSWRWR